MINFFDDTNSDNDSVYESLFWPFPIENEENEESDCSPIIEDDNINNSNILQTVAKEPINTTNLNLDGTNDVTKKKLNLNYPLKALPKIGNFTHFCPLNSIRGILVNKIGDIDNDLITKIVKDEYVSKAEEYLNPSMKININNEKEDINDNIVDKGNIIDLGSAKIEITEYNSLKKKRGRKTENTGGKEHNRFSGDNIIKKIKAIFFNTYHEFINLMIKEYYNKDNNDKKETILKIQYKNIDNLKKDYNLELLKKPLKYSFSLDVSDKYRTKKENKDYNAKIIKEINDPNKYTEIEDYNTIKFILDISLTDWIDLFTYKKDISTLADEYHASDINIGKIQDNFIGAIDLLKDIPKDSKEDQVYYSLFILYLFNFQRWFWIKKGRNVEKKKIE
jgi:hypothetical protein